VNKEMASDWGRLRGRARRRATDLGEKSVVLSAVGSVNQVRWIRFPEMSLSYARKRRFPASDILGGPRRTVCSPCFALTTHIIVLSVEFFL
jgi:hypothetical protein